MDFTPFEALRTSTSPRSVAGATNLFNFTCHTHAEYGSEAARHAAQESLAFCQAMDTILAEIESNTNVQRSHFATTLPNGYNFWEQLDDHAREQAVFTWLDREIQPFYSDERPTLPQAVRVVARRGSRVTKENHGVSGTFFEWTSMDLSVSSEDLSLGQMEEIMGEGLRDLMEREI